jgi:hypothetical protein
MIPYSWWSNSLFLLDTGRFGCRTTSCRPCHPPFLPGSRSGFHHFCECACFSWLSTEMLWLSDSVDFLSLLDMHVPVFIVLFVCVCVFLCHSVHRQTNRHSTEISEIVPARTHTRTWRDHSHTLVSCGVDECDADSLSLLIHTYIHRHTSMHVCLFLFLSIPDSWLPNFDSLSLLMQSYIPTCILVCVCMYIFVVFLFVILSILYSWWANSLFLLDTGSFGCRTTSCRPCHPAFLPGFHRLGECSCFSWLFKSTVVE